MNKTIVFLFFITIQVAVCQRFGHISFRNLPQNLQLYPRDLSNKARVFFTGEVEDTSIVKISILVQKNGSLEKYSKQTLHFNNNQGFFEFGIEIKAELSEYDFDIFSHTNENDSSLVVSRKNIVAGDAYVVTGQSNSYNGFDFPDVYKGEFARSFGVFTAQNNFDDYNPADTLWYISNTERNVVGFWASELQRLIIEKYKVPVCIINGGSGGSSSEYNAIRNETNPADLTNAYGRLLFKVQKAGLANDIKAFFYRQGENEADGATLSWKTNFEKIYKNIRTDLPSIKKVYIFQNNLYTFPNNLSGLLREHQRIMQNQFADLTTIATIGTSNYDGVHYSSKGYMQTANEVFRIMEEDFYGEKIEPNSKSPNIKKVFYKAGTTTLTLVFDEGQQMEYPEPYSVNQNTKIGIEEFLGIEGIQPNEIIGSADKNRIVLKLKSTNIGNSITYFPAYFSQNSIYTPFFKPSLANKLGMRALTFEKFYIKEALATPTLETVISNRIVQLKWQKVDKADKYELERKAHFENDFNLIASVHENQSLNFEDNKLELDNNYSYRIKAINAESESEYSAIKEAVFSLATPQMITVEAKSNTEINVSWNHTALVADILSIELSADSLFENYIEYKAVWINNLLIIDKLEPSRFYYLRIKAIDTERQISSKYTKVFTIKTLPNSPQNLNTSTLSEKEIILKWKDNSVDEIAFVLMQSTDGEQYGVATEIEKNAESFAIKNLIEATKYFFKIAAKNELGGLSAFSNVQAYTKPAAPSNLKVTSVTTSSINLVWVDNSKGETGYQVFIQKNSDQNFEKVTTLPANSTEWIVNELLANNNYRFKILAISENGDSEFSDQIEVKTLVITETEAEIAENNFNLYPNPVSERIYFSVNKMIFNPIGIKIFNQLGSEVFSSEFQNLIPNKEYSLKMNKLSQGIYFFEISYKTIKIIKKFIKN
ncbi:MAG: fibronectin type III domain-containing protein [Bacteroidota bacterium]